MRLHVVSAGAQCLIEDSGRDHADWGVARSGAADRGALALANRIVGNDPGAAAIECLLGGLALRAEGPVIVAVTGADCPATIDGQRTHTQRAVALAEGQTLALGPAASGLRAYVAVRGGVAAHPVLGSRSRDVLGLLGPPPLSAGAVLEVGQDARTPAWFEHVATGVQAGPVSVRIAPGPRCDWFTADALDAVASTDWSVRPESDRTGLRLAGPALARRAGDLPSEPTVVGAVQVPPDGQPIILGPDSGVSGGYPVVAVVHDADLDRLAQLRPGDPLRMRWSLERLTVG